MKGLTVILILVFLSAPVGAEILNVSESITVSKPQYSFFDLLAVQPDCEELKEKLKEIELDKAPDFQETHQYSRQYLLYLLQREGVDQNLFEIPEAVEVNSELKILKAEELEKKIKELLQEEENGVLIEFNRYLEDIHYPSGELNFYLDLRGNLRIPGNNSIPVVVEVDYLEWDRLRVSVFLDREQEIYVLKRSLETGEEISPDNLTKKFSPESDLPRNFIPASEELEGLRVRRTLSQEQVLCWHHLEEIPLVERGDRISLQLNSSGLTITVPGEALEDGNFGEEIRVRNYFNGEIIRGRVARDGTVEIEI